MPCVHCIVEGRVQGVGFRYFTRTHAQRLGVTGWVRNRTYGDVELVAEASQEVLDQFLELIRQGPRGSSVTNLSVGPSSDCDSDEFIIRI